MEIGELAGLKKAEVETLRSFLSRQNDIYRAAFGKRATPHLRQCVFFGTTNAESGYLRDTTGNRRFWPVKTPGSGKKQSWNLTHEEILQIWAEALVYVRQGEKLYLSPEMDALAKDEQREAMESDEREGLVREYMDTLLPERWAEMDLFERRNFLAGSDFGNLQEKGTVKRTSVSNMEIWCECFGKERANLRRTDSNELTGILARLGWKRAESKVRIPLYGPAVRLCSEWGVPECKETLRHKFRETSSPGAAFLCSPNIYYISKDKGNKGHQHAKHAYTRIRGIFSVPGTQEANMREKAIEAKLVKAVRIMGGLAPKFVSPGFDGVPDRLVLLPKGKIAFIELKSPGKALRPLQIRRKQQLEALGFPVYRIDSPEQIGGILDEIQSS